MKNVNRHSKNDFCKYALIVIYGFENFFSSIPILVLFIFDNMRIIRFHYDDDWNKLF